MLQRVCNRIWRHLLQLPVFRVPSELAYKVALEKHIDKLPVLLPTDLTLVDTLEREGIVITSLETLAIPSNNLLLQAIPKVLPNSPKSFSKSRYVVHAASTQLMNFPELFLWGLEERILNIVENYLGLPVAYHGLYVRRDLANNLQTKSRLWHIDMEDRRNVKVVIYLNDVSDEGGPFQCISKDLTLFLSSSIKYNYGYVKDEIVKSVIPSSHWKSCIGAAGTVIIADTANIFHRGKVPVMSDRLSIFFDYTSRRPKHPFYCKSSFSKKQLYAIKKTLSLRQKESVFWR